MRSRGMFVACSLENSREGGKGEQRTRLSASRDEVARVTKGHKAVTGRAPNQHDFPLSFLFSLSSARTTTRYTSTSSFARGASVFTSYSYVALTVAPLQPACGFKFCLPVQVTTRNLNSPDATNFCDGESSQFAPSLRRKQPSLCCSHSDALCSKHCPSRITFASVVLTVNLTPIHSNGLLSWLCSSIQRKMSFRRPLCTCRNMLRAPSSVDARCNDVVPHPLKRSPRFNNAYIIPSIAKTTSPAPSSSYAEYVNQSCLSRPEYFLLQA